MGNADSGCCVAGRDPEKAQKAAHREINKLARAHSVSDAVTRARDSGVGTANVSARYHKAPIKIEDDYVVDRKKILGEGGFASVCLASDKAGTSSLYAIKSMSKVNLSPYQMEELDAEIEIFLAMDHPNVVRLAPSGHD